MQFVLNRLWVFCRWRCHRRVESILFSSLFQSGSEQFSHLQRRCSMVYTFPYRSQFGSGRILDLNALLFVYIVRLRIWNAVSRVFRGKKRQSQHVIGIVENLLSRMDSYVISDSIVVCWGTPMEVSSSSWHFSLYLQQRLV